MKLKIKLKPIPLALASLLCASSVGADVVPELMASNAKNETKAIPPAVKKLAATMRAPKAKIELASAAPVNTDAAPVPTGTSLIKLALHEPVIQLPEMTVGGKMKPMRTQTEKERYRLPQTSESITRERMDNAINLMVTEDAIKYMPSIQVRSRYIGDTNAPVGMRTSGTSASARNLIYADGILLSSLLGNNNTNTGSPR
jgi:iron complex outermembrane receptor protein